MRFHEKKAEAYLTVEACVLVSLAFFLFAFLIHLIFYMHARTVLVQDAYLTAFRASMQKESEDVLSFIDGHAAWQFGGKYFGSSKPRMEARTDGRRIDTHAETTTNRTAYDLALPEVWEVQADACAVRYDMPLHIRRIARIKDLAEMGLRSLKGE